MPGDKGTIGRSVFAEIEGSLFSFHTHIAWIKRIITPTERQRPTLMERRPQVIDLGEPMSIGFFVFPRKGHDRNSNNSFNTGQDSFFQSWGF
jgi:hypothetical protein